MSTEKTLGLFEGYGIECEYMIVDRVTFQPLPITDKVLTKLAGELTQEIEIGEIAWSNELVLHVIELKGNGAKKDLVKLKDDFYQSICAMNEAIAEFNAVLLPTAMHPFLNPTTQTKLWPHGDKIIYETYNKIFSCTGHGWSNLQSIHINLPFANDDEFGRLHAAVRMTLPLLPALAASSPIVEGKLTGHPDNRLLFYKGNQAKVPSITGKVVPEAVFNAAAYEAEILQKAYREIAAFDPEGTLKYEWLNSRGAIARFDRNAIEIRVLDIQESPRMDFAIIGAVVSLVRSFVDEVWLPYDKQKAWTTEDLAHIFNTTIETGLDPVCKSAAYLNVFGINKNQMRFLEVWSHIGKQLDAKKYEISSFYSDFENICVQGNLAQRMTKALENSMSLSKLCDVLSHNLAKDQMFEV